MLYPIKHVIMVICNDVHKHTYVIDHLRVVTGPISSGDTTTKGVLFCELSIRFACVMRHAGVAHVELLSCYKSYECIDFELTYDISLINTTIFRLSCTRLPNLRNHLNLLIYFSHFSALSTVL